MPGTAEIDSFAFYVSISVVLRPCGSNRVRRGGSFDNDDNNLRASNRNDDNPSDDNDNLGFRCASPRRSQKDRVYGFDSRACCGHGRKTSAGIAAGRRSQPSRGAESGTPGRQIAGCAGRMKSVHPSSEGSWIDSAPSLDETGLFQL